MPAIKAAIPNPVYSGSNIYSSEESPEIENTFSCDNYKIIVKRVKVYSVKENPKLLLLFLNNGLRNIMRKLDYVEIGRSGKYFNSKEKNYIDNLMMFNGFKSSFIVLEKGIFLRVDSAKKIVRN